MVTRDMRRLDLWAASSPSAGGGIAGFAGHLPDGVLHEMVEAPD
jgi:hypothetical protein